MENIYFFELKEIQQSKFSNIFVDLKNKNIFFSHFQVDQKFYLLIFNRQSFDPEFCYQTFNGLQELNTKHRRIRSFRGFFLYALEIQNRGKNFQILETNLPTYFWNKIPQIIRQNQKNLLNDFLFQNFKSNLNPTDLQNQINQLEKRIFYLENQIIKNKVNRNSDFMSSTNLEDEELIEILKIAYDLKEKENISFKVFFESSESPSLYQLKGYKLKYNNLRRTKAFRDFKP